MAAWVGGHRLGKVGYARQHGIKATARAFQTTVPTGRKGLRRCRDRGWQLLASGALGGQFLKPLLGCGEPCVKRVTEPLALLFRRGNRNRAA